MTRDQAFDERLLQILDRIFPMQVAEGWRDGERARAQPVDRMALCAMGAGERHAALHRRLRLSLRFASEGRERNKRRGRQYFQ